MTATTVSISPMTATTVSIGPMTATRSLVVHAVTGTPRWMPGSSEGYEVQSVNLASAAYLLRMSVADFDCVRVAAALSDIQCCPFCRGRTGRSNL